MNAKQYRAEVEKVHGAAVQTEIANSTMAQLKEHAKQIGVGRAASDTKVTFAAKIAQWHQAQLEFLTSEEYMAKVLGTPKATVADVKAKTRRATSKGICNVCNKRPAGNDVGLSQMCQECADEGGWENTHNDEGHGDPNGRVQDDPKCWICHPELNRASDDYVAPKGSSKQGMTVVAKGDKITLVVETLRRMGAVVRTETNKNGYTGLVASLETAIGTYQIEAGWNGRAFYYPASSWNGKKFRNVSELFRLLGVQA